MARDHLGRGVDPSDEKHLMMPENPAQVYAFGAA
jgi:hypothetical protein